jgi:hypothetical protein
MANNASVLPPALTHTQRDRMSANDDGWARRGERSLHTGEVVGSIPTAPTIPSICSFSTSFPRCKFDPSLRPCFRPRNSRYKRGRVGKPAGHRIGCRRARYDGQPVLPRLRHSLLPEGVRCSDGTTAFHARAEGVHRCRRGLRAPIGLQEREYKPERSARGISRGVR